MINHHVNRILQHKGYEALFSLEVIKLLTCRWPAAQAKHVRKLQHLQNYSCVNDQKKSDSFRFTLITNNVVILQNYLFFFTSPICCIASHSIQKGTEIVSCIITLPNLVGGYSSAKTYYLHIRWPTKDQGSMVF